MSKPPMRFIFDDHHYIHDDLSEDNLPQVQNFVLTRFNIPLGGARDKGGFQEEDRFKEWCRNRSGIFNRYCLPSMARQVKNPTAWIILFDQHYAEEVTEALDAIKPYHWIVPVMVDGNETPLLRTLYSNQIKNYLAPDTKYVITTRLDNDDALSYVYCQGVEHYVQSAAKRGMELPFWISFPYGVQWDGQQATLLIQNNNPFLSMVEDVEAFRTGKAVTAMSANHGRVFDRGHVRTPSPRFPMWLQYVHGENVSNKKNEMLFAFDDTASVLKGFGIAYEDGSTPAKAAPKKGKPAGVAPVSSNGQRTSLDEIGMKYGTDKASNKHNFLDVYDLHLDRLRHGATAILELGVFNGASLKMWKEYFAPAQITGADITPKRSELAEENIAIEIGDCGSAGFLAGLGEKYGPFDLVVDDASHFWHHQQIAFDTLWQFVKPGGVFIIEDINTSYFEKYGKGGAPTMEVVKKNLDLLVEGLSKPAEGVVEEINPWKHEVLEVSFIRKSCIVVKRSNLPHRKASVAAPAPATATAAAEVPANP